MDDESFSAGKAPVPATIAGQATGPVSVTGRISRAVSVILRETAGRMTGCGLLHGKDIRAITPGMLDLPLVNEPSGISDRERRAVRCEIIDHSDIMENVIKEKRKKINGEFSVEFFILLFLIGFNHGLSGGFNVSTQTRDLITMGVTVFFAVVFAMRYRVVSLISKESNSLLRTHETMNAVRWSGLYTAALNHAARRHCVVSPELKAMRFILDRRRAKTGNRPALSAGDVIGMVRLSDDIRRTISSHKGAIQIDLNGEQSELLCRVSETLTGNSMKSIMEKIIHPKKVRMQGRTG